MSSQLFPGSSLEAAEIVDITGRPPLLPMFRFIGDGGTSTIVGFYVSATGAKVGTAFTLSATTAAAVAFPSIPSEAVGVYIRITGSPVFWTLIQAGDTAALTDFTTNPTLHTRFGFYNEYLGLGRVG